MANPLLKGDKFRVWIFLKKIVEKFCAEFVKNHLQLENKCLKTN